MNDLKRIENKRMKEFSKARLNKSLAKFKTTVITSRNKLVDKHGTIIGTTLAAVAIPMGVVIGLTCSKETVDKIVSKRTKKES